MKHLFHMMLLMLSFSSFGGELSTLKSYVEYGKGLSPAFYEDVMKNIKLVSSVCKNAPDEKRKLLTKLDEKVSNEKDTELLKAQIAQTPRAIINSLTSQIEKIQGAKAAYQETPTCSLEKLGIWFPSLDNVFGKYSISSQFDYAINYLQSIIIEMDKVKNYQQKNNDVEFTKVTDTEERVYSFCHEKLSTIVKELNHEK